MNNCSLASIYIFSLEDKSTACHVTGEAHSPPASSLRNSFTSEYAKVLTAETPSKSDSKYRTVKNQGHLEIV